MTTTFKSEEVEFLKDSIYQAKYEVLSGEDLDVLHDLFDEAHYDKQCIVVEKDDFSDEELKNLLTYGLLADNIKTTSKRLIIFSKEATELMRVLGGTQEDGELSQQREETHMTTEWTKSLTQDQARLVNTIRKLAERDAQNRAYVPVTKFDAESTGTAQLLTEVGVIDDYHKHSDGRQRFRLTKAGMSVSVVGDGSTL